MSGELERLRKHNKVLDHENSNLRARERHSHVTGGRGSEGGGALEADKKKVNELMGTVESLQTEKAVSATVKISILYVKRASGIRTASL